MHVVEAHLVSISSKNNHHMTYDNSCMTISCAWSFSENRIFRGRKRLKESINLFNSYLENVTFPNSVSFPGFIFKSYFGLPITIKAFLMASDVGLCISNLDRSKSATSKSLSMFIFFMVYSFFFFSSSVF